MIKKLIKNTIIATLVINFILCLILNIYTFFKAQNILNEIGQKIISSNDNIQLTISIREKETIKDFVEQQYFMGQYHIISWNFFMSVISLILGFIISLIISIDESKVIKYILIFMIGVIFINGILTFVFVDYNSFVYYINFIYAYIDILKSFFILYVILYLLFICIKLLIAQHIIKQMNSLLKK